MILLQLATSVLFILALVFILINWKLALGFLVLGVFVHGIPQGPSHLLRILTGLLFLGGLIYVFIDWRIGLGLIVGSIIVAQFWIWSERINERSYRSSEKLQ